MASEKTLNTRITLRIDTFENWSKTEVASKGANLILKRGEIGLCEIPAGNNSATTAPTVLFKVGDGTTPFSGLNWASALAADVYSWAKASDVILDGKKIKFVGSNKEIDLSGFALSETVNGSLQALSSRVGKVESILGVSEDGSTNTLATQIAAAVAGEAALREAADAALDAKIGAASAPAVGEEGTDGYVPAKAATGVYVAIEKAQSEVDVLEGVVEGLRGNLTSEATTRENADKAINDKIGTVAEGKTVVGLIGEAQAAAEGKVTTLENGTVKSNTDRIKAIEDDYLKGSDKESLEGQIEGVKTELKGTANDESSAATIAGAKKYADEKAAGVQGNLDTHISAYDIKVKALDDKDAELLDKIDAADESIKDVSAAVAQEITNRGTAIEGLQGQIDRINTNIASGLHFIGVFDKIENVSKPENADFEDGDICIVGTQEYIYYTKQVVNEETGETTNVSDWEELGNAEAHANKSYVDETFVTKETYNDKITDLEKIRGEFATADTTLKSELEGKINGKVAQGDFDTLEGRVDGHDTVIAEKLNSSEFNTYVTETHKGVHDLLDQAITNINNAIKVADGKTIAGLISEAQAQADKGVADAATAQAAVDALAEAVGLGDSSSNDTLVSQIAAHTEQLKGINAALDSKAAQADLTALTSRVSTNEGNITTLQGKVADLENTYTNAQVDKVVSDAVAVEAERAKDEETKLSNRIKVYEDKFGLADDILVFNCGSSTTDY